MDGKSKDSRRALREEALKEARGEPDFDMAIFNTVYPPIKDSDEESLFLHLFTVIFATKITDILHYTYIYRRKSKKSRTKKKRRRRRTRKMTRRRRKKKMTRRRSSSMRKSLTTIPRIVQSIPATVA